VGSAIGGILAEHAGYAATGYVGCAGCLLGLFVGFPSLFRSLPAARPIDFDLGRNS
jgi:predicted MFS family arabinose efflux permease